MKNEPVRSHSNMIATTDHITRGEDCCTREELTKESYCTYLHHTVSDQLSRGKPTESNYSTTCEASFRARLGITTGVALTSHLKRKWCNNGSCAQQLFRHVYSDNHGDNDTPKERYDVCDQKSLVCGTHYSKCWVFWWLCTQRLCISASNSSVQCEVATN